MEQLLEHLKQLHSQQERERNNGLTGDQLDALNNSSKKRGTE